MFFLSLPHAGHVSPSSPYEYHWHRVLPTDSPGLSWSFLGQWLARIWSCWAKGSIIPFPSQTSEWTHSAFWSHRESGLEGGLRHKFCPLPRMIFSVFSFSIQQPLGNSFPKSVIGRMLRDDGWVSSQSQPPSPCLLTGSGFRWRYRCGEMACWSGQPARSHCQYQGPSASGCLDGPSAKTSHSHRQQTEWLQALEAAGTLKASLLLPCSLPGFPSPHCRVDAIVITVCILKGFYIQKVQFSTTTKSQTIQRNRKVLPIK